MFSSLSSPTVLSLPTTRLKSEPGPVLLSLPMKALLPVASLLDPPTMSTATATRPGSDISPAAASTAAIRASLVPGPPAACTRRHGAAPREGERTAGRGRARPGQSIGLRVVVDSFGIVAILPCRPLLMPRGRSVILILFREDCRG